MALSKNVMSQSENFAFSTSMDLPLFLHEKNKVGVVHKPNSVFTAELPLPEKTVIHLRAMVARRLLRPTRELRRAALNHSPIWSCTGWGLPSFPGRPENWCALTAPFHPYPALIFLNCLNESIQKNECGAVCSLLHFPSRCRDSTLWSTLPCGVRTFLRVSDTRRPPGPLWPCMPSPPSGVGPRHSLSQYRIL